MVTITSTQLLLFLPGLLIGVGATALYTLIIKRLALRFGLVDKPNERSVHKTPIPRVGGIAIVGGFFTALAYFQLAPLLFPQTAGIIQFPDKWILFGAGMMFCVGLFDDILNMKAKIKLFFQILAALVVVGAGFRFHIPFLQFEALGIYNDYIAAAITFLWVIGIINAVNLMDGMDGLAAGMAVIAISFLTIALAINGHGPDLVLVTAFIAALLGFLLFNSHPASIFMGDCGSLFLGFILATFSLPSPGVSVSGFTYLIPIIALGLPILDTLTAIVRRTYQGKGIFTADKDHIHHRMLRINKHSQKSTVYSLYAVNAIFGVLAVLLLGSQTFAIVALVLSLTALFVLLFLVKLGYIELKGAPANTATLTESKTTVQSYN